MNKRFWHRYSRLSIYLVLTDYAILVLCFAVALRLRFMPGIDIINLRAMHVITVMAAFFAFVPLFLLIFAKLDLYKRRCWLSRRRHLLSIVRAVVLSGFIYMLAEFLTKSPAIAPSRAVLLMWVVGSIVLLVIHRLQFVPWLRRVVYRTSESPRRVVVVGDGEAGRRFALHCQSGNHQSGLHVVGFILEHAERGAEIEAGLSCLGHLADLPDLVGQHELEGAVITDADQDAQQLMDTIEICVRLFGWVDVHTRHSAALQRDMESDTYFDIPVVRLGEVNAGPLMAVYKRVTDLSGAVLGLTLLALPMLLIAALVKLTSPGPVFHVSTRVGHDGRTFPFYKFRSMRVGAEGDSARRQQIMDSIRQDSVLAGGKVVNQSLVTPLGRVMRKWAIDELPQLFNVLQGDMSLIGPRPVLREEYEACNEWQKRRFDIKPGCTGLWKIFVTRGSSTFSDSVLYDIYYARNMSPLLDAFIVLGTLLVIVKGRADG